MVKKDSLVVGEAYSYKKLCDLFNEKARTSNSKKAQTREWKRYFTYERDKHKYVIKEIYDEPLPEINDTKYIRFIEYLLAYELSTKEGYEANYTKMDLYKILGMVNDYYLQRSHEDLKEQVAVIPKWQVDNFFLRSRCKLSDVLMKALGSMKKRHLIAYTPRIVIVLEEGERKVTRLATNSEVSNILETGRRLLKDMDLEKEPAIWTHEFYTRLNKQLDDRYGIKRMFKDFEIVYKRTDMISALDELGENLVAEMDGKKHDLNLNIVKALNDQAQKYFEKNKGGCDKVLPSPNDSGIVLGEGLLDSNDTGDYKSELEDYERLDVALSYAVKEISEGGVDKLDSDYYKQGKDIDEDWGEDNPMSGKDSKKCFKYGDDYVENQKMLANLYLKIGNDKGGDDQN